MVSEVGDAYQTPFKWNKDGKTYKAGIRKTTCLDNDKKIEILAFPIDWKKLDVTIWKPTIGNDKKVIFKPIIDISIKGLLFVNANAIWYGKNWANKKPLEVTIVAITTVYL